MISVSPQNITLLQNTVKELYAILDKSQNHNPSHKGSSVISEIEQTLIHFLLFVYAGVCYIKHVVVFWSQMSQGRVVMYTFPQNNGWCVNILSRLPDVPGHETVVGLDICLCMYVHTCFICIIPNLLLCCIIIAYEWHTHKCSVNCPFWYESPTIRKYETSMEANSAVNALQTEVCFLDIGGRTFSQCSKH